MSLANLTIGERFTTKGRDYEIIEEKKHDVFKVKDLIDNVTVTFTRKEIVTLLMEGKLEFSRDGKNAEGEYVKTYPFNDLSLLPEKVEKDMRFRFMAIEPLIFLDVKNMNPYIMDRVEQLKKDGITGVSRSSLYRWYKTYKESGNEMYSLISSFHKCGSKDNRLQREVEIIIDEMIEKHYKKGERKTIKDLHLLVYHKIDEENKLRSYENRLIHPSTSTIGRRIKDKDQYEIEKARKGEMAANKKYGHVTIQEKSKYPLQRVEADHTRLDIFLVDDETRLPIGRPYITKLIDCFTGYPLGLYIGFEHPSYTTIMHAMKHAFFPKYYLKEKYPSVQNEWVAYGIPETLVVDRGKDFTSKHLEHACKELNIKLVHCPPRKPWWKGTIERHFRTHNQQFIHQAYGTTFSNILDKGEYDPTKHAVIGFKRFLEMYHKWVVDIYGMDVNKGVKGVPSLIWKKAFKNKSLPGYPKKALDWEVKLMKLGHGTIQNYGVKTQYLYYQSKELRSLRNKLDNPNDKIQFKYDPTNLGKIYVYDEFDNRYIEAYCTEPAYANGLNEYTHKIIYKNARKDVNDVNISALAASKAQLQEQQEEEKETTLTKRLQYERSKGTGSDKELKEETNKEAYKQEKELLDSSVNDKRQEDKKAKQNQKVISLFESEEDDWGFLDVNG
jgi:putative transposase